METKGITKKKGDIEDNVAVFETVEPKEKKPNKKRSVKTKKKTLNEDLAMVE